MAAPRTGAVAFELAAIAGSPRGVLVVDNVDSFPWNLAHLLAQLGADVAVVRNDAATVEDVLEARPRGVLLSPGPKTPVEAGISVGLVRACAGARVPLPLFGVCLGHQSIGAAFGARIVRAAVPVHGRATDVTHRGAGCLVGLPSPFRAARYHSLVVEEASLPRDLVVTARSPEGEIMAMRHRRRPIEGVQFHPESYLTPEGPRILAAFLRTCGIPTRAPAGVIR